MGQHVVILAILGLVAAYQRGDRETVAHLGANSGPAALSAALVSTDRDERLAAIEASTAAGDDAWRLLVHLAERAAERDRRVAATAARAAVRIAEGVDRRRVIEWEIPADALRDRVAAWRALAADRRRWPDVRVHAMEVAALLSTALDGDAREPPYELATSLADPEPEVRRAALELLPMPLPEPLRETVAARVTADGDPTVALVAAQTLCTDLALGADPASILTALGADGLVRLRALVLEPDAPPAAVLDAARCLAADPAPDSAAVLRKLRRGRARR